MNYKFNDNMEGTSGLSKNDRLYSSFCIHRVNLPDKKLIKVKELVGSKSGISVINSKKEEILLPPGSSAEVDFWILGDGLTVLGHNNPSIKNISSYPSLNSFLEAWKIKRDKEVELGITPGFILANLKTHGGEEGFLNTCSEKGIPKNEVVFLDAEYPAIDRLLRNSKEKTVSVSLRTSRVESFDSVLMTLRQKEVFGVPHSLFFDPIGFEDSSANWPYKKDAVTELYSLAPDIKFIVCCPSRWGMDLQIEELAKKLKGSGFKNPIVMTDIDKIKLWESVLNDW